VPGTRAVGAINSLMNKYRKDQLAYIYSKPAERLPNDLTVDPALMYRYLRMYRSQTSTRPYRAALSVGGALAELRRCSGSQFHPRVVRAFCDLIERPDSMERQAPETVESTSRS
jgi:hypothetical protein